MGVSIEEYNCHMDIVFDFLIRSVQQLLGFRTRITLTNEHKAILTLLNTSHHNVFITGKAGTGKTTLIDYFRENTEKKVVVLAPTGLAALNIRGQTISSFFRFPPRVLHPNEIKRVHNTHLYTNVDCLIIDEVSMMRADMLDAIDTFLRLNGRDKNRPFGGVQLVLVGDMYQLPPVVTREEREIYHRLYPTPYFFSARSFDFARFRIIELTTIFRQNELKFVEVLNKIRMGDVSVETLSVINQRVKLRNQDDLHVILCTTNAAVHAINQDKLSRIESPQFTYLAATEGHFPTEDRSLPAEMQLTLKKGARVLFLKNDKGGRWVNGSLGTVSSLSEISIFVKIDDRKEIVEVQPTEWENIRYDIDTITNQIAAVPVGKLIQYPLRLAWAITIHKSQGMSFDRVCVDFSRAPFTSGQTYVALSRCRTLDGLILTRKIWPNDILVDDRIIAFYDVLGKRMSN